MRESKSDRRGVASGGSRKRRRFGQHGGLREGRARALPLRNAENPVVLDQKGCLYQPRVVALMTNQPLEIRNSDPTIHNVHAMPKSNAEWNRAQRAGTPAIDTSFQKPELAIPLMCNVHPWMRAFVFVFDHPYFSVTGGDGKFELKNLPPGTYTIEAWQEKLGTRSQTVTLGPREAKQVSFRFKSWAVRGVTLAVTKRACNLKRVRWSNVDS